MDQKYTTALLHLGLLPILIAATERGTHDLMTQAANCICLLLLHAEEACLPGCLPALRVFASLLGTFVNSSPDQLHMTLRCAFADARCSIRTYIYAYAHLHR